MAKQPVNIVIMRPLKQFNLRSLDEKYIQQIKKVSPRVKLMDISALMQDEESGDVSARQKVDAILAEAEIFNGFYPPQNLIARAPLLKWIHSPLTGVDSYLTAVADTSIWLTNSRGIHGAQASEMALTLMLMLAKQAPLYLEQQKKQLWKPYTPDILCQKTAAILGLGVIGKELAKLLKVLHMKVLVIESRQMAKPCYIDAIRPPEKLLEILAQSDFVLVTLPLTPETNKLLDEAALRSMKSSAYLVNVARGGIIDEEVLVRALKEKWIAGAGLDVFETEPLPAASPFWQLPNVIITPHCAGRRSDYDQLATDLFCKNLRNYLNGKALFNLVNITQGF